METITKTSNCFENSWGLIGWQRIQRDDRRDLGRRNLGIERMNESADGNTFRERKMQGTEDEVLE